MAFVSVCEAFGAFCSVSSSHMVVGALGLTLSSGILCALSSPCACSVFVALLAWPCGLNHGSLAVIGVPSLPPPPSCFSSELSGSSVTGV